MSIARRRAASQSVVPAATATGRPSMVRWTWGGSGVRAVVRSGALLGKLMEPPLVLRHGGIRLELRENLDVLQCRPKCGRIRSGCLGPRFHQFGTAYYGQTRLLPNPDRAPVIRGHDPLALFGDGQAHRLA